MERAQGEFRSPSGVEVDREGRVYVADFYNHRIQVFDGDGNFLYQFGEEGHDDGQLYYPTDLAISGDDEALSRGDRNVPGGRAIEMPPWFCCL